MMLYTNMICFYVRIIRLFFGGFWYIKLESIYIQKTNRNFDTIVTALSYFDSIISGAWNNKSTTDLITDKHVSLLIDLFNQSLNDDDNNNNQIIEQNEFDGYIKSSFECFIRNKVNIAINYSNLNLCRNERMVHLIMHQLEESKDYKVMRDENDLINLFKSELLFVFKNVKIMTLITYKARPLSMLGLLNIIKNSLLQKIFILSAGNDPDDEMYSSWQSYLWKSSSLELIAKYKTFGYNISLEYEIGSHHRYHGFEISKT